MVWSLRIFIQVQILLKTAVKKLKLIEVLA